MSSPSKIALLTTTFPKASEAFLQREVQYLLTRFPSMEIYSLHGGERSFLRKPVRRFSKWNLLMLLYWLPYWFICRPRVCLQMTGDLFRHSCPSFLNFQETMLGLGFALCRARSHSMNPCHWRHAVWATMPATAALLWHRLLDLPFSMEAHAYDIFQGKGDWLIRKKLESCAWIRTSTEAGKQRLLELGADPGKIKVIRRGLLDPPPLSTQNETPTIPLKLISAGRFVPKKGLSRMLDILETLRAREIPFTMMLVGEGPLRSTLEDQVHARQLQSAVTFTGFLSQSAFQQLLVQSHFLLFTGEKAADGNQDGLPNVIPEAMAAGAVVLSTRVGATAEAILHGETGYLLPQDDPGKWADTLLQLVQDKPAYLAIRAAAREWVSSNYQIPTNLAPIVEAFQELDP